LLFGPRGGDLVFQDLIERASPIQALVPRGAERIRCEHPVVVRFIVVPMPVPAIV
jgi:hypothetical protein